MSITYSKGIIEQIKDNPTEAPFNLNEFMAEYEKCALSIGENNQRRFTVLTGPGGYRNFQDVLQRTALLTILEDMLDHFTPEEMTRMKEMINSDDTENMILAGSIIDLKLKPPTQNSTQDVSHIQSGES